MQNLSIDVKQKAVLGIKLAEIIEQCNGLDYMGILSKEENKQEPYPKWAFNLSSSLQTISESRLNDEEALQVLKKGLLAAIVEISNDDSGESSDIFELMMFLYRHKKRDEVLKAMFLKQIMHGDFDKNIELYQKSAEIIGEFLYD